MAKRHSKEFKVEAVALLRSPGMTVARAARDLGVAESQLYKWRKEFAAHGETAFPGKGNLQPQDEELRRLRREIEQLRMERDILKKAALVSTGQRNARPVVSWTGQGGNDDACGKAYGGAKG